MPVIALTDAGLYRRGASFTTLDWACSVALGIWPEGSTWLWTVRRRHHQVTIIDGRAVRDDGAVLKAWTTRYQWNPLEDINGPPLVRHSS